MKNRKRSKGPADSLLGLLFPAVLLLVMVINLIVPDREMSEAENRKLAEKPQLSMNNAAGGDFMEQYEGEPSEESEQYIRSFAKEVNQVSKEYEEAEEQYAQGMLSDDAYIAASMKYESYENEREFLAMIEHQQNYLQKLKKEQGISGWYVNTYCYQSIFQPVISLKYGLLLVFTLLTAVSSAKIEADAGTINVLNSTRFGRRQLLYKKVLAVSLTAGIMYAILLAVTLGSAVSVYGISVPDAPVQSLEWYAGLPLPVSLLQWMILYYGMILLVLLLVSIGFTLLFQKVFRHA